MPRVYVIILNYKKWVDVTECLETLLRSQYDDFTAIIIDNNSQNNSLQELVSWAEKDTVFAERKSSFINDILKKPIPYKYYESNAIDENLMPGGFPKLVFIQNEYNKGFAAGINTILKGLINEDAFIWLLNPDMIVEESTLTELLQFRTTVPRKAIIGCTIKYYSDPGKVHLYAGGKINFNSATVEMIVKKNEITELDYISGGSLFTHAGNFIELGLLPTDYFLYWEETDFCYRAKQQGYRLYLCETAVCYDKISTSIGKNFLSDYYYTRNGLLFLSKYRKEKVGLAIFFTIFRLMKRMITGRFDRAKGMYGGMKSFLNRGKHETK